MSEPCLSVIIPALDAAREAGLLRGVLVVAGGSGDQTVEVAAGLGRAGVECASKLGKADGA